MTSLLAKFPFFFYGWLGLLWGGVILGGCSYQFEGTNPSLPGGAQSIGIEPIQNQTFQAGLETRLMRALRELLRNNASVRLVTPEEADLTLQVVLTDLATKQTSLSSDGLAVELQLTLQGQVNLKQRRSEALLWRESDLNVTGALLYEKGEESRGLSSSTVGQGLDQVTQAFAKRIYERLFFNF